MSVILYYIFYVIVWTLAWLPLSVLYGLSYKIYFIVYYIARYRIKTVRRNLYNSFPEKSKKELIRIEKDYYLHFADICVETLKLLHISKKNMQKRMYFSNPEELGRFFDNKQSAILLLGHYGNWEWITSIYMHYSGIVGGELYRPLKNKHFDRFFLNLRERFGTINIPKNDALRTIVKIRREGKIFGLGFISDQTPSPNNLHYWTTFLNQDTPFLNGPERIARQTGCAVVYFDIQKKRRGYYTCDIITITENGKETKENEITDKYVELFEKTIRRNPAYWLWTHNRWKHKRI